MKFPFPRPSKFKLIVRKSPTGHGLYAGEAIPKNRFLIEYWGTIITNDHANRVGGRYLFNLDNGTTIQGSRRENTARYINHSCKPNCEARDVGNRIFIFSKRKIKEGEELTYDYGKEYVDWFIKRYGCKCGPCIKKKEKSDLPMP